MRGKAIHLACETCSVIVRRYQSQLKTHTFCGRRCQALWQQNGTQLFCAYCDAEFYRRYGEQDIGERVNQFCSRECYSEFRIANMKVDTYPKHGAIHRHRIVAENRLGRPLRAGEVVHHIDLDKHNCEPVNLMVFQNQSLHMLCHRGKLSAAQLRKYRLVK